MIKEDQADTTGSDIYYSNKGSLSIAERILELSVVATTSTPLTITLIDACDSLLKDSAEQEKRIHFARLVREAHDESLHVLKELRAIDDTFESY